MEPMQRDRITKNLVMLIKDTNCNTVVLAELLSAKIIGDSDCETLESLSSRPMTQAKKLYEIIQSRVGAYDALVKALRETNKTGALKLLLDSDFRNLGIIEYDKNQLLGNGSFGTKVYRGTFEGREVAVKVLNTDLIEPDAALRETKILIKLDSHENILRYFLMEQRDNLIYIALELCLITLQDEVKIKLVNIPAVIVLHKISQGLAHLHGQKIIHRDLKPANVLLNRNNQVKISDFGISKQIPNDATSVVTGSFGTADWMAPEILQRMVLQENQTPVKMKTSTDIFSLGCIFYFVLTNGLHPFGDALERLYKIRLVQPQLENLETETHWKNLISLMISSDPNYRPSIQEILNSDCFMSLCDSTLNKEFVHLTVNKAETKRKADSVSIRRNITISVTSYSGDSWWNANAGNTLRSTTVGANFNNLFGSNYTNVANQLDREILAVISSEGELASSLKEDKLVFELHPSNHMHQSILPKDKCRFKRSSAFDFLKIYFPETDGLVFCGQKQIPANASCEVCYTNEEV